MPEIKKLTFFVAVLILGGVVPARGDSFEIFNLGSGLYRDLIGIEDSGAVVIYQFNGSPAGCTVLGNCYETYVGGVLVTALSTNPSPVYDNGTSCTPTVSPALGGDIIAAACNNGYEVYGTGIYANPPYVDSIFDGPDPVADYFGVGPLDEVRLNSSGDFAFLQGNLAVGNGTYYEAIDLTPEPGGFALVSTGMLALWGARRRLLQLS